ncbi:MAG: acetyl-CoA hydrolase/transferase C-terminal domain-containing protein [Desulfobacterales bacterium]
MLATNAVGTENLYEFIHDNPSIEFYPSDYVCKPGIIAQNNKMTSVNMVMEMDITGQAAVDALPNNYFAGVSSMLDSSGDPPMPQRQSILLIPSTSIDGEESRIVSQIDSGGVVIPRGDVSHVVSDSAAVNLFGKISGAGHRHDQPGPPPVPGRTVCKSQSHGPDEPWPPTQRIPEKCVSGRA